MKAILLLQAVCVLAGGYLSVGETVKPLVVLSGADSKLTKGAYLRIDTNEQWAKTWSEHVGTDDGVQHPMMEIDFSNCMVAAIFRGGCSEVR